MANGTKIGFENDKLIVPDDPIIPFIEGDGTGPDIWRASQIVFDAAVKKVFNGKKKIVWKEVYAGEKAFKKFNTWLPDETLSAIQEHIVGIKGPLTTPVGGGIRSLNVALRQKLNLFTCMRPVKYIPGVPSPVKHPEKMDVIIFRENTEDLYAGIEWAQGVPETIKLIRFLKDEMGAKLRDDSGIGIKPISITATKQLMRMAIKYALDKKRRNVTIDHKGNIMKYTEGAFREWAYQVAKEEFRDRIVTEEEVEKQYNGKAPAGKLIIKDRIADNMFQQVLTRADEYDIIVTPNLNGDYLSDACAAQVGGLGMAPGGNIGIPYAIFEATHGTAPKYAGQDKVNPGSVILSGAMMFEYLGWDSVSQVIKESLGETIKQKKVTYDLERQMEGAALLKSSEFAKAIVDNMDSVIRKLKI
ncbi:MAG: isocitrate dehydrogenase (NADP(+)) [Deltaproteobacteria bacterium]|nr:isocitrate dehydrogenase (NADP(+)) [Deltaproteobacteria bacterium]